MKCRPLFLTVILFGAVGMAVAQSDPPNHQHYVAPAEASQPGPQGQMAPRLQNLGRHSMPISCKGPKVQAFFNQGINLAYGFNHAEAARAFQEVARLAPDCAMAYWGHAFVLGPNINAPMDPASEPKAHELIQKAISLKAKASAKEREYIDAMAARYSGKAEDRGPRDRAFAEAMRKLSQKYPADTDAASIFAESLMDLRPWNYWTRDGVAYPGTEEIVGALEGAMKRNPLHPGALHLWIHLWEAPNPERAEDAADKLLPLLPGAGHMVHMPGHIYQRVGRYDDVVKANQMAAAADEDYITQCKAQGLYPLGYYPHNVHFLWFGATMAGRSKEAIDAAYKTASTIPLGAVQQLPFLQGFLVVPYHALVRFGKWDQMLKEPKPLYDSPFTLGMWHYGRGRAFVGKGQLDEAVKELVELRKAAATPELTTTPASFSVNTAASILAIAPEMLAGEMEAKKRNFDQAVLHLDKAVRLSDALIYTEPDDWTYPPRHSLGAVLLEAGRAAEAETIFWDDLKRHPENGWALYGLWQALKAQKRDEAAAMTEQRLKKAWASADFQLTGSRF